MRRYLVIAGLCLVFLNSRAQFAITPYGDVQGTQLREIKYENVSGSPYLLDVFSKGKVTTTGGKTYLMDSIKYDQVEDALIFKDGKGLLMHFKEPVYSFELDNKLIQNGYSYTSRLPITTDGLNASSFFQPIATGKISLYKKTKKIISESKTYGYSVIDKTFKTTTSYYLIQNNNITKINPGKKSLTPFFKDKEAEMEAYIRDKKIDFKDDLMVKMLLNYFNQL